MFLVDLQIKLSKICGLLHEVKAGILSLKDVIDFNKNPTAQQVQNFFIVMEVYGAGSELDIKYNQDVSDHLTNRRKEALNVLTEINRRLGNKI